MKKPLIFIIALVSAAALSSCSGDHTTTQGKDTAQYQYSTNSYMDTFKVTSTLGDASNLENGGNGGSMIQKASPNLINIPSHTTTAAAAVAAPADTATTVKK